MRFIQGCALAVGLATLSALTGCGGDSGGSSDDVSATSEAQATQGQSIGEFTLEGGIEETTIHAYFTGLDLCTEPGSVGGAFALRSDEKTAAAFFNLGAAPEGHPYPPVVLYKELTVTPDGENGYGFLRGQFEVISRIPPLGFDNGLPGTGEMILDSANGILYASCADTATIDINKPHYIDTSGKSEYASLVAATAQAHDERRATLVAQLDSLQAQHQATTIDDVAYLDGVSTRIEQYTTAISTDLSSAADAAQTESTEGYPDIATAASQLFYWLGQYDRAVINLSALSYLRGVYDANPSEQAGVDAAIAGVATGYDTLVARYE